MVVCVGTYSYLVFMRTATAPATGAETAPVVLCERMSEGQY